MEEQKKEFTGVWIPRHILEDTRLKPVARLIYAEVSCFDVCTMSNETLSNRAGCSEATAGRTIKQLKELGYIRILGFNGRIRKMSTLYDKPIPPSQNDEADSSKTTMLPTQNDAQDNNIENKEKTGITNVIGETPEVYGKTEINDLFIYWNKIVGYEISSRKQQNRNACNNLLKKYGYKGVEQLINAVQATHDDKYAPRISDFSSLQSKLNDLLVWAKKKGTAHATAQF